MKDSWCKRNKERCNELNRKYRAQDREKIRDKTARLEWYDNNKTKVRCQHVRYMYGLTCEEYQALVVAQHNRCAICGKPPGQKRLNVDHDHKTGEVRGLLCQTCNAAIGFMNDDAGLMQMAIDYLVTP